MCIFILIAFEFIPLFALLWNVYYFLLYVSISRIIIVCKHTKCQSSKVFNQNLSDNSTITFLISARNKIQILGQQFYFYKNSNNIWLDCLILTLFLNKI